MAERYTATLCHDNWNHARTFVGETESGVEACAAMTLLRLTAEYRDWDEHPDDDDWIEVCLSEGWSVTIGILVE